MSEERGTPDRPVYSKMPDESLKGVRRGFWIIRCDEGWRDSIVCTGMYEWAADWLVEQLQGKPFAPGRRP